jgi:hypothetical protein
MMLAAGPSFGAIMAVTFFLVARGTGRNTRGVHPRHINFSWPNVLYGVARQSTLGLMVVMPIMLVSPSWVILGGALGFGVLSGLALGLAKFADPDKSVDFDRSLRDDRRAFVLVFLAYGLPIGLLSQWFAARFGAQEASILAGVACGISGGLSMGLATCWARYTFVRCLLAAKGVLPWRLAQFLMDARQRGVLRRSGAAYEFRHDSLLGYFAGRVTELSPTQST